MPVTPPQPIDLDKLQTVEIPLPLRNPRRLNRLRHRGRDCRPKMRWTFGKNAETTGSQPRMRQRA